MGRAENAPADARDGASLGGAEKHIEQVLLRIPACDQFRLSANISDDPPKRAD